MSQQVNPGFPQQMKPPSLPANPNHGRTVAGWAFFWGVCLGALIIGIGAVLSNWTLIWVGIVVCVLAGVVSLVMRVMGYGQPRADTVKPKISDPYP